MRRIYDIAIPDENGNPIKVEDVKCPVCHGEKKQTVQEPVSAFRYKLVTVKCDVCNGYGYLYKRVM